MKLISILSLLTATLGLSGCDKLEKTIAAEEENIRIPVLTPMGDLIIKENNKEEEVTFAWSAAYFGYPAITDYGIHAVYSDENGESDIALFTNIEDTSYVTTKEILNGKFCTLAEEGGLGIPEYATASVGFYVTATVGSGYTIVRSEKKVIQVTTARAVALQKCLYVPGGHQGWNPGGAQKIFESEETDVYTGYLDLNTKNQTETEFKFTSQPNWDGPNYGGSPEALDPDEGAGNLKIPSGFYKVSVDLANMKADMTLMEKVALIGSFNEWKDDQEMEYDFDAKTYSTVVNLSAGGEFKIRFNGNWDYNLGGDINDLTEGSSNIKVEEAGNYFVKFFYNYETYKYCLTVEKQ